jgi:hypothetical protein
MAVVRTGTRVHFFKDSDSTWTWTWRDPDLDMIWNCLGLSSA